MYASMGGPCTVRTLTISSRSLQQKKSIISIIKLNLTSTLILTFLHGLSSQPYLEEEERLSLVDTFSWLPLALPFAHSPVKQKTAKTPKNLFKKIP